MTRQGGCFLGKKLNCREKLYYRLQQSNYLLELNDGERKFCDHFDRYCHCDMSHDINVKVNFQMSFHDDGDFNQTNLLNPII